MKDITNQFFYSAKAPNSERNRGCEHLYWRFEENKHIRITQEEYEKASDDQRVMQGSIHSTVKPVDVMSWLIARHTKPGDVILDPFAGSGTTGVAAIKMGRDCKLIEMDEEGTYADIIRGRLHGAKEDTLANLDVWESPPDIQIPDTEEPETALNFEDFFF